MPQDLIFRFKTACNEYGAADLLDARNLEVVGVKQEEIERVETFFEVPGILYSEPV